MAEFNPTDRANDMADGYTRRRSEVKEPRELLHYKSLLNKARSNPENHSMPICHKHIFGHGNRVGPTGSRCESRETSGVLSLLSISNLNPASP